MALLFAPEATAEGGFRSRKQSLPAYPSPIRGTATVILCQDGKRTREQYRRNKGAVRSQVDDSADSGDCDTKNRKKNKIVGLGLAPEGFQMIAYPKEAVMSAGKSW